MKQYMLLPEDNIELLRAQDEAEAAVCVFCERTMILFRAAKLKRFPSSGVLPRTGCIRSTVWSFLRGTRCLMRSRRF